MHSSSHNRPTSTTHHIIRITGTHRIESRSTRHSRRHTTHSRPPHRSPHIAPKPRSRAKHATNPRAEARGRRWRRHRIAIHLRATQSQSRRRSKTRRRASRGRKARGRRTRGASQRRRARHARWGRPHAWRRHRASTAGAIASSTVGVERARGLSLAGADAEGVFGEGEADAALDGVVERVAVELVEGLCGEGDVLELDEAHGAVLLGAEAEAFVAALLGKHGFELVFGRVDGEIADVERVAGRILVGWVDGWVVVALVVLRGKLVVGVGSQGGDGWTRGESRVGGLHWHGTRRGVSGERGRCGRISVVFRI